MLKSRRLIFFVIILGVYALVNAFVFSYGSTALSHFPIVQRIFTGIFWTIAPLFIVARIVERSYKNRFVSLILWIGSFWLAMLTYLVLSISVILLISGILGYLAPNLTEIYLAHLPFALLCIFLGSFLLSASGWRNARHAVIRKLEYVFPRGSGKGGVFHIVAATDIHLGTIIGKKRFGYFIRDVNALKPDAIFFVGDTIDEDIEPVIKQDIGTSIRKLHAPLGVFAVNGNHEHIGWVDLADAYLREHWVTVLQDASIVLGESFTLVGREDVSLPVFSWTQRSSLASLLAKVDPNLPIILLDHQPSAIRETAEDGRVALQLSGHTHHGQLWPFSWITRRIFEISWGGRKIKNTEFYVSSGWGTWGPPVRTGNVPELLDIHIRFE